MRKLQALTKALQSAGAASDATHAFADRGVLMPTGRDLGHGIEIGRFKYDAVIQLERYPDDAYALLAFVTAWLQVHDPDRESQGLGDPDVDFEEALELVPDESGPIEFDGKRWAVAPVPIDVADGLDAMEGRADAG
jgi:hypothetical protein